MCSGAYVKQQTGESSKQSSAATVLVVDDNHSVNRALGVLLERAGFSAVTYTSGRDALKHAVETPTDTIAAAVLDIHLPDLNGLILAQKLRQRFGPSVPIIVVSGDTSMETLNSLSHVGATYFFSKPINSDSLVQRLKELVGEKD